MFVSDLHYYFDAAAVMERMASVCMHLLYKPSNLLCPI